MSYIVLARKYRPQTFAEVLEQGHVTGTLSNALSAGRVAHALLFAGPRGTGKTTIARILAKALNCQAGPAAGPCNACRSCQDITAGHAVDVYEIDGASNNSVDQIRELRENIKYMPAHSPYKIYIIDEVHMLSTPAFNALLKTLEEPPAHALFMFATTEPHKIPITILSRCQRFDLRRIRLSTIAGHLEVICRREGVEIDAESLELIARESGGSVRDGLSLLDQVISGGQRTVSSEQVLETLGVIDRSRLYDLADAVLTGEAARFLAALDDIFDRGHDLKKLFSDLLEYVRDLWVIQISPTPEKLVDLPGREIELMRDQPRRNSGPALEHVLDILYREEAAVRLSSQPKLALEMAFFKVLQTRAVLSIDTLIAKLQDLRRDVQGAADDASALTGEPPAAGVAGQDPAGSGAGRERSSVTAPLEDRHSAAASADRVTDLQAAWQKITERIAVSQPSLAAKLKRCCLKRGGAEQVEIATSGNSFIDSTLRRDKHMAILKKACAEVFGGSPEVTVAIGDECSMTTDERRDRYQARIKETLNHPLVADAIEIFDGKLVDVKVSQEVDK
ncbi:MAG: DNA polymerase III subunit gamma/tau [Hyphomicrobiales bacterium]